MTIRTTSAGQTREFGKSFAKKLTGGAVICLYGNLGAGKTTLVQGIARGLGIKKRVISPTFVLMRQYNHLYHIDLYRLETVEDTTALGLEELWSDPANILLIEWPEKIQQLLPKDHWEIKLTSIGENEREISYEAFH